MFFGMAACCLFLSVQNLDGLIGDDEPIRRDGLAQLEQDKPSEGDATPFLSIRRALDLGECHPKLGYCLQRLMRRCRD